MEPAPAIAWAPTSTPGTPLGLLDRLREAQSLRERLLREEGLLNPEPAPRDPVSRPLTGAARTRGTPRARPRTVFAPSAPAPDAVPAAVSNTPPDRLRQLDESSRLVRSLRHKGQGGGEQSV